MTCWVLCRDTTMDEYDGATEPVCAFTKKNEADAALTEMNAARDNAHVSLKAFWDRRRSEVARPLQYDWREREIVGSGTHMYFEALATWDTVNGKPPEVPPTHILVEVPLR